MPEAKIMAHFMHGCASFDRKLATTAWYVNRIRIVAAKYPVVNDDTILKWIWCTGVWRPVGQVVRWKSKSKDLPYFNSKNFDRLYFTNPDIEKLLRIPCRTATKNI